MDNKDCVFCKIGRGEIPSFTVFENENWKAILDIAPASKGHIILFPKEHTENIFTLSEKQSEEVFPIVKKIADALKRTVCCEGINILQNNGEVAGQTVFHFHIHLIPRYEKDTVQFSWENRTYQNEEMQIIADGIKKHMN